MPLLCLRGFGARSTCPQPPQSRDRYWRKSSGSSCSPSLARQAGRPSAGGSDAAQRVGEDRSCTSGSADAGDRHHGRAGTAARRTIPCAGSQGSARGHPNRSNQPSNTVGTSLNPRSLRFWLPQSRSPSIRFTVGGREIAAFVQRPEPAERHQHRAPGARCCGISLEERNDLATQADFGRTAWPELRPLSRRTGLIGASPMPSMPSSPEPPTRASLHAEGLEEVDDELLEAVGRKREATKQGLFPHLLRFHDFVVDNRCLRPGTRPIPPSFAANRAIHLPDPFAALVIGHREYLPAEWTEDEESSKEDDRALRRARVRPRPVDAVDEHGFRPVVVLRLYGCVSGFDVRENLRGYPRALVPSCPRPHRTERRVDQVLIRRQVGSIGRRHDHRVPRPTSSMGRHLCGFWPVDLWWVSSRSQT